MVLFGFATGMTQNQWWLWWLSLPTTACDSGLGFSKEHRHFLWQLKPCWQMDQLFHFGLAKLIVSRVEESPWIWIHSSLLLMTEPEDQMTMTSLSLVLQSWAMSWFVARFFLSTNWIMLRCFDLCHVCRCHRQKLKKMLPTCSHSTMWEHAFNVVWRSRNWSSQCFLKLCICRDFSCLFHRQTSHQLEMLCNVCNNSLSKQFWRKTHLCWCHFFVCVIFLFRSFLMQQHCVQLWDNDNIDTVSISCPWSSNKSLWNC